MQNDQFEGRWPGRSLLGRSSRAARTALLEICRPAEYPAGTRLLRQGERDNHAIILLNGTAKVYLIDRNGFEVLLAVRRGGDVIGELAALSNRPRTASVVAVNDIRAGILTATGFKDFLAAHADAAQEMILIEGERLEWANRRRMAFFSRSAASKVADVLVDLAADGDETNGKYRIELSQADLASIVGIKLATAQAALRTLSDAGLIERRYRAVVVGDLHRLMGFADSERQNP